MMETRFQTNRIVKQILEQSIDGCFILDSDGLILKANRAYCNMVGYLEEELIGRNLGSLDFKMTTEVITSVFNNGSDRFETQQKCKDGSLIEIEISTQYFDLADEKLFLV